MKQLSDEIIQFLHKQGFVIVSTIDDDGTPHVSCKGIVNIEPEGKVYLLDLYKARTYKNLKHNSSISLTAVDEHKFIGYCLKGKASIVPESEIRSGTIEDWENKIVKRISSRVLKEIHEEKGNPDYPEVSLPKPEYMIIVEVKDIIDLAPHPIK